jgi:hypothetical protein
MDDARVRELVQKLDTAKALEGEIAWNELRPLGVAVGKRWDQAWLIA